MLASEDLEEFVSTSQPTKLANSLADKCRLFWRKAGHKFSHPLGVKPQHVKYVRVVGQVGFVAKGVVYALIGGLSCQSAIHGTVTIRGADNSPQGAFILVGNNQFGYPLLIVMALTVYMYACWRFWEGVTGQGSDDAFGKFKNFFKYRLSPLVSGCVYTAYGAFCISLIPRIKHLDTAARSGGFPQSIAGSWWGDIIICILGLAFLIAFVTQMQAAFTRNFHYEMKEDLPVWFDWILIVTGHIGFLGRSGVFLFVAILMFRTIANPDINNTDETTIGNALSQLQKTHAGQACLFILGFFLIVYGTFAVSIKIIACSCSHACQDPHITRLLSIFACGRCDAHVPLMTAVNALDCCGLEFLHVYFSFGCFSCSSSQTCLVLQHPSKAYLLTSKSVKEPLKHCHHTCCHLVALWCPGTELIWQGFSHTASQWQACQGSSASAQPLGASH